MVSAISKTAPEINQRAFAADPDNAGSYGGNDPSVAPWHADGTGHLPKYAGVDGFMLPVIARVMGHGPRALPNGYRDAITAVEEAINILIRTARIFIGDDSPTAAAFASVIETNDIDDRSRHLRLMEGLEGIRAMCLLGLISIFFEAAFFEEFMPRVSGRISEFIHAASTNRRENGQGRAVRGHLAAIELDLQRIKDLRSQIDHLSAGIRAAFMTMGPAETALQEEASSPIGGRVRHLRALVHDTGNILSTIEGVVGFARESVADNLELIKALHDFDISEIGALMGAVINLNLYEANRRGVDIKKANLTEPIPIPADMQRDVFRILFELVRNSIKHRNPDKTERWARLDIMRESGEIFLVTSDNGMGMTSHELGAVRHAAGTRLRPDLSPGRGEGVTGTIEGIAKRRGWSIEFSSNPGVGTVAILKVPLSHFNSGNGAKDTGGTMASGMPLPTGIGQAAAISAMDIGGQILAGQFPLMSALPPAVIPVAR